MSDAAERMRPIRDSWGPGNGMLEPSRFQEMRAAVEELNDIHSRGWRECGKGGEALGLIKTTRWDFYVVRDALEPQNLHISIDLHNST